MTSQPDWRSGTPHPTGGYDKVIVARGDTLYFTAARLHRLDGPAVEAEDGSVQYWVAGQQLTEQQFRERGTGQPG
ncbi:hypothetical protein GCM10009868_38420 [Terrabacter aerolatus]|uniref:Uncharacterized protein n=1 Tax=Terrabacter aerolatus TaxID=422442 RepID=A0A512D0P0_9MICO|nr:hypothetical protein [Terrabacter aerolatus]GEO30025.1 hypothetical protein TAE01_18350 [Terrabacter aerolatus]